MIRIKDLKEYREKFIEWSLDTTCHGYSHFISAKKSIIKIMWLISIVAAIGSCSNFIIKSIIEYFNYEVNTNIKTYSEFEILFPAVTICSLNPFKLLRNGNYFEYNMSSSFSKNLEQRENYLLDLRNFLYTSDDSSIMDQTGLTEIHLMGCLFTTNECSFFEFKRVYDINYGNCLRFNAKYDRGNSTLRKTISWGYQSGLYLELYTGLLDKNLTGGQDLMSKSGFHLVIHNNSVLPTPVTEGIDIKTNSYTSIGIRRTFTSQLSYPYSKCKDTPKLLRFVEWLSENEIVYRQKDCLFSCVQEFMFQKCKCNLPNLKKINKQIPFCSFNDSECVKTNFKIFSEQDFSICLEDCPPECESSHFTSQISNANYPTRDHLKFIRNHLVSRNLIHENISDFELSNNVAAIDIYYEDMTYTNITEVEKTTVQSLISTIGGHLGLFLGMSFLSFIEAFEILIEITCIFLKR